jgi:integrase
MGDVRGADRCEPNRSNDLRAETPRDRVLTNDEIYAIWRALQSDDYSDIIRLLLLTGQRRGEVGDLRWDEIDFDHASATLPASRTKNNRPHEVPLSAPVLDILRARHRLPLLGCVARSVVSAGIYDDRLRRGGGLPLLRRLFPPLRVDRRG